MEIINNNTFFKNELCLKLWAVYLKHPVNLDRTTKCPCRENYVEQRLNAGRFKQ